MMRRTLLLAFAVPVLLTLAANDAALVRRDGEPPVTPSASAVTAAKEARPDGASRKEAASPAAAATPPGETPAIGSSASADAEAEGTVEEATPLGSAGSTPEQLEPGARSTPIETTFLTAPVPAAGAIAGTGPRWRYTIEIEPGLDVDIATLAADVRAALHDQRSWARSRTLEQVDDPSRARIRVVLASPDTVDELCGRAGLRTAGIYSCWNGRFAALNAWRWEFGADGFPDIATYRNYLVNHEFGHGLGYGHVGCPQAGAPAPVMMQQSKGLAECVANGWPYP